MLRTSSRCIHFSKNPTSSTGGKSFLKSLPRSLSSNTINDRSNSIETKDYDIVINGGGVVGAAFAASILHKTKGACKIAIVEQGPNNPLNNAVGDTDAKFQVGKPDLRVYALSPKSTDFLDSIGAWKFIKPRSQQYNSMQVWEGAGPGIVRFDSSDLRKKGIDYLGHICEDITIQAAIYKAILDSNYPAGTVDLYSSSSIASVQNGTCIINTPDTAPAPSTSATMASTVDPAIDINPLHAPPATAKQGISATPSRGAHKDTFKSLRLRSQLLVGADGANSIVRKLAGISTWGWEYGQEALVATVSTRAGTNVGNTDSTESHSTAWQKYLSSGLPLALLPLWGGYSSIVWSTSIVEATRLKALPADQFLVELNAALQQPQQMQESQSCGDGQQTASHIQNPVVNFFRKEAKSVVETVIAGLVLNGMPIQTPPMITSVESRVVSFPLSFKTAKTYYSTTPLPVVLIGDSAHTIHPQAGQGLNLGLVDADTLADAVCESMKTGANIGDQYVLQKYSKERYRKNLAMMTAVDCINAVFQHGTNGSGATKLPMIDAKLRHIRSIGMLGVNSLNEAKGLIAKFAMGRG